MGRRGKNKTDHTVVFDHHDLFKGHIRLVLRLDDDGREHFELHIGSRQLGFWGDGEFFYAETNYSVGPELLPTAGHGHECVDCAIHGLDSEKED